MIDQDDNTTIERAPKDRDNPYGMLRRATFDGSPLTFEERGVLAYILMKPDNWRANIKDLMREGDIGRNKTYLVIKKIIDKGYAERIEHRDEKGRFQSTTIRFFEQPHTKNPHTEKRDTDNRDTENDHHNNKGSVPITDQQLITEKEQEVVPDGTPPDSSAVLEKKGRPEKQKAEADAPPVAVAPPQKEPTEWQKFLEELCWIAHGHTEISALRDADKGLLMKEAKKIKEKNYTIDDLRIWYTDIWKKDWKSKDSRPNPAIVRASIPAIRSRAPLGFDTRGKEADNGEDEDNGGWDADELAAIKAARAAGDYALAGQIGREGNKRWKERMSQVQGHRLAGR